MRGIIIMTEKDLEKIKVMQQLLEKQITQEQAAKVLSISDRQVRNIFKTRLCKFFQILRWILSSSNDRLRERNKIAEKI